MILQELNNDNNRISIRSIRERRWLSTMARRIPENPIELIELYPKQKQFVRSNKEYTCYGGAWLEVEESQELYKN